MPATSTSEYGAHVADVMLRGAALGAQIGNAARSARIALQQQQLEQAQLQLQVRSMNIRQAEFQQRQAEFLQTTEEWKLRRKGLELAISSAEALGPVQKAEAANRLFQANLEMQNQLDWAKFGPLIDDALREDADSKMQAYMESTTSGTPYMPPMNETLRQLYKDKPHLMASPPVMKKQAALNNEVERYRQSWRMSSFGRSGSGTLGGVAGEKLMLLQQYEAQYAGMVESGQITPEQAESVLAIVRQQLVSPTLVNAVQKSREDLLKSLDETIKPKLLLGAESEVADRFKAYARSAAARAGSVDEVNQIGAQLFLEAATLQNVTTNTVPSHWGNFGVPTNQPTPTGVPQGTTRTNIIGGVPVIFRTIP